VEGALGLPLRVTYALPYRRVAAKRIALDAMIDLGFFFWKITPGRLKEKTLAERMSACPTLGIWSSLVWMSYVVVFRPCC